jgi:hypothetical protein
MEAKAAKYYKKGLWKKAQVIALIEKGLLSPEAYERITGEEYIKSE